MRILIYGGGFNPPHLGHRAALMTARKALKPDRTIIIPDGMPPHKQLPDLTPDPEIRLRLCRLQFAGLPDTEISKLAIRREGPCYMVDTLRLLRTEYPKAELILLLGSDMLLRGGERPAGKSRGAGTAGRTRLAAGARADPRQLLRNSRAAAEAAGEGVFSGRGLCRDHPAAAL